MQTSVPVSIPEQSLRQCARRMHERGLHRIYVVVDHELAGVISTREMLAAVAADQLGSSVQELGLSFAETLSLAAPLSLASERFCANAAGVPLVVTDGSRPVGVFSRAELRACLEADAELSTALFMDDRVVVVPAEASLDNVARDAFARRARYVIATDAAGRHRVLSGLEFAGIVSGRPPSDVAPNAPLPAVSVSGPGFRAAEFEEQDGPFVPPPSVPDGGVRSPEEPVSREIRRGGPGARNEPK
jgi:CBS domain-containing protein